MQLWFLVGVFFLVIEAFSFGLIAIWFAIGAFLTIPFYQLSIYTQFYIFVIFSFLLFFLVRNIAKKHMLGKSKELNGIVGKLVEIQGITQKGNLTLYTVFLDGKTWGAISEDSFELNEKAVVVRIEGNKLVLKKHYNTI